MNFYKLILFCTFVSIGLCNPILEPHMQFVGVAKLKDNRDVGSTENEINTTIQSGIIQKKEYLMEYGFEDNIVVELTTESPSIPKNLIKGLVIGAPILAALILAPILLSYSRKRLAVRRVEMFQTPVSSRRQRRRNPRSRSPQRSLDNIAEFQIVSEQTSDGIPLKHLKHHSGESPKKVTPIKPNLKRSRMFVESELFEPRLSEDYPVIQKPEKRVRIPKLRPVSVDFSGLGHNQNSVARISKKQRHSAHITVTPPNQSEINTSIRMTGIANMSYEDTIPSRPGSRNNIADETETITSQKESKSGSPIVITNLYDATILSRKVARKNDHAYETIVCNRRDPTPEVIYRKQSLKPPTMIQVERKSQSEDLTIFPARYCRFPGKERLQHLNEVNNVGTRPSDTEGINKANDVTNVIASYDVTNNKESAVKTRPQKIRTDKASTKTSALPFPSPHQKNTEIPDPWRKTKLNFRLNTNALSRSESAKVSSKQPLSRLITRTDCQGKNVHPRDDAGETQKATRSRKRRQKRKIKQKRKTRDEIRHKLRMRLLGVNGISESGTTGSYKSDNNEQISGYIGNRVYTDFISGSTDTSGEGSQPGLKFSRRRLHSCGEWCLARPSGVRLAESTLLEEIWRHLNVIAERSRLSEDSSSSRLSQSLTSSDDSSTNQRSNRSQGDTAEEYDAIDDSEVIVDRYDVQNMSDNGYCTYGHVPVRLRSGGIRLQPVGDHILIEPSHSDNYIPPGSNQPISLLQLPKYEMCVKTAVANTANSPNSEMRKALQSPPEAGLHIPHSKRNINSETQKIKIANRNSYVNVDIFVPTGYNDVTHSSILDSNLVKVNDVSTDVIEVSGINVLDEIPNNSKHDSIIPIYERLEDFSSISSSCSSLVTSYPTLSPMETKIPESLLRKISQETEMCVESSNKEEKAQFEPKKENKDANGPGRVNDTNDLERDNATNDLEMDNSTNDYKMNNATNDFETVNASNDPEIGNATNDLKMVNATNGLKTVNATNDLKMKNATDDLEMVNATNDLELSRATNDLETIKAKNDLENHVVPKLPPKLCRLKSQIVNETEQTSINHTENIFPNNSKSLAQNPKSNNNLSEETKSIDKYTVVKPKSKRQNTKTGNPNLSPEEKLKVAKEQPNKRKNYIVVSPSKLLSKRRTGKRSNELYVTSDVML
ncbi:uncharacterized protein LOC144423869 [Styela clava]